MKRARAEVEGSIKNAVSTKKSNLIQKVLDRLYQQFIYIPLQRKKIMQARQLHFLATKSVSVFKERAENNSLTFEIWPTWSKKKANSTRVKLFDSKGNKRYIVVPKDCGIKKVTVELEQPKEIG